MPAARRPPPNPRCLPPSEVKIIRFAARFVIVPADDECPLPRVSWELLDPIFLVRFVLFREKKWGG